MLFWGSLICCNKSITIRIIRTASDCASYIEGVFFSWRKQLSQIIHCKIGGSYNHWNDWVTLYYDTQLLIYLLSGFTYFSCPPPIIANKVRMSSRKVR
ncbi:unnamed protein product [Rhizophagus irregularis]|uniref:Uncharacterized protein n=1 Tax=Rhizophagus irregularis TaxID=588596 RepID=A0A915YXH7_9GLOM|nr:unnamed protein product [Rhizophagus irregularis]CAB5352457.1 unnamed protein product [Rhizophagus irregularis]